jgi:ABC-2 type transport system ATP-binding protein
MITIKNVTKKFPGIVALNSVSFDIKEKEFFGLLGPNGAGKSTLINIITGYLDADLGEIIIEEEKVSTNNLEIRKKIGLVPQSIALYDDISAQENLEIFGSLFGLGKKNLQYNISEKLNMVGLFDRRKDKVKNFSGGMKRRLNLAASILHDPEIILCDEPTVGIDPQSRNAIFEYLEKLNHDGKTIIYTTHYMEEAERLCSRIAIIDFGKIISAGTLQQLLENLDFKQTIVISKNHTTEMKQEIFTPFGRLIDEEERFELQPSNGFKLSQFFETIEKNGINYSSVNIKKPSLELLFLHLTGRSLRD